MNFVRSLIGINTYKCGQILNAKFPILELKNMKPNFVHCLFEQSGTFKRAFKELGIPAWDYDIQDQFGETDIQADLFKNIELAYENKPSVLDGISKDDLIFAFFPCIYFCEANMMFFMGTNLNYKKRQMSSTQIIEDIIKRDENRHRYYVLLLKLFHICESRQLRLIVENPYNAHHYLRFNFPYKPAVIDMNRRLRGDFVKKPTQYFFLNCEPAGKNSVQLDKVQQFTRNRHAAKTGGICSSDRSMISPDYAHNFICDHILGIESGHTQPLLF